MCRDRDSAQVHRAIEHCAHRHRQNHPTGRRLIPILLCENIEPNATVLLPHRDLPRHIRIFLGGRLFQQQIDTEGNFTM